MKTRTIPTNIMAVLAAAACVAAPIAASAQRSLEDESHHRQQQKNQWRNIGIGSAALGLFGLLKHDNTLTFAGAGGALYSANRYEQDRKSQSRTDRARAEVFSRRSFDRDGHHYVRRTVHRNGQQYY
jgi:Ni/Co efflux regulator RcnB